MALPTQEASVALLIDCDNVPPEIAEFALQRAAQAGRVTIRRGYGNPNTINKGWEQVLVRQSFTSCLQFPYAPRKNSTDIALSLDALELLLDKRAQTFCLVTGDSDFAYLCRKLRERGAIVYIAGAANSPEALRKACDQFFEWTPVAKPVPKPVAKVADVPKPVVAPVVKVKKQVPKKPAANAPPPKQSPPFVVKAVEELVTSSPNGRVTLNALSEHIRLTRPTFKPGTYGHAKLVTMVKTYPLLKTHQDSKGHWTVSLASKTKNGSTAPKALVV
ncbi:NYN domain-containing protein [Stenotrophomonas sp. CFBP8994]|uniref:NYN domain-containing protein n=1 Tax=Stenotrophomonas sp. CFBP8994 TaxID=3096527 RepID=UPI002A6A5021|nr:NYN domain-containing protein [Stenotrophomonas sp. CFBP8994]MDY0980358.1 NYN domain-containing protein [Stenotrophomonas sp. CFBP8994]